MATPKYPGETTAEEWNAKRFWFWLLIDHGNVVGMSRTEKRGLADRELYGYCKEHASFELTRRRITWKEAVRYALSVSDSPEARA